LRRRQLLGGLSQDIGYAMRQWRRAPGLSIGVVLLLGLGIGGTATMFGVVDRLLLRPPPYIRDAGRMGRIYSSRLDGESRAVDVDEFSYRRFALLREAARGTVEIAASGRMPVIVARGSTTTRLTAGFVS